MISMPFLVMSNTGMVMLLLIFIIMVITRPPAPRRRAVAPCEDGCLLCKDCSFGSVVLQSPAALVTPVNFAEYGLRGYVLPIGITPSQQPEPLKWSHGRGPLQRFYWTTHQSGEPRLDDIDAIVAEPNHDPRRRRYRRLILQWKKANGASLLTGSSLLEPNELSIPLDLTKWQR
jgi:hypothetical protein